MPALLGLDFGEKRIGVAVTDEGCSIAIPLTTLPFVSRASLLIELLKLIEIHQVDKIVVGLPKKLDGTIGIAAEKTGKHAQWLREHLPIPVVEWDERMTTQEIARILLAADMSRARRKEVRDKLAAQRILHSYLEAVHHRQTPE